MTNELWIAAVVLLAVLSAVPGPAAHGEQDDPNAPPPRIKAWMDRLTVDHAYDPETGFIVAREVITLPPVIAEAPPLDEALETADGRLVVAFATADRCAPCQEFKKTALNDPRVVEALSGPGVLATHVEVDRTPGLAQQYLGSLGIPMSYALRDGERVATLRGQRSADTLLAWLDEQGAGGRHGPVARETIQWHEKRLERLRAEDGWLSLVGLEWLDEGANTVGADPESGVVYAGFPADRVATLHVEDGAVRIEPAADLSGDIALRNIPADGRMTVDSKGSPTVIAIGGIRFHIIERDGRLAVRIKDADAPTLTGFTGIDRYTADADWRITARFEPASESVTLGTVIEGVDAEVDVAGIAEFERDGHTVRALLFPSGEGFSLRFGDATNGSGTYPIGRYLSVPAPAPDGRVLLDFNRSYNPPCAFTRFATCTLPPEPNDFPFAVDAGERWSAE